jgi:hypothetical protein
MTKNLHFTFMILAFALSACQKENLKSPAEASEIVLAKPGSPTTTTAKTLYLDVEVINSGSLKSDGKGVYSHGKERVQAVIWDNGDFYLQTNTNTNQAPIRLLGFEGTGFDNRLNNVRNHSLRTEYTTSEKVLFQNMIQGDDHSQIVGFRIFGEQKSGSVDWRLRYRYGPDATNENTTFAKITRISATEWFLESDENHTGRLVDGSGGDFGYPVIPFALKLKSK